MIISYKSTRTEEAFGFDDLDASLNSSDLAGWKWDSSSLNGHSRYSRNAQEMKATLSFFDADSAAAFMALIDADTEAGVEGILTVTGWSIHGNISAGSLSWKTQDGLAAQYEVTFRSDWPIWYRDAGSWSFPASSASGSGGLDYPHDYPFDFCPPPSGRKTITVDSICACEFEIVVYGAATNPSITINGINHEVDCSVPSGSLLFVNSLNNKRSIPGTSIFLRDSAGSITNEYGKQNRSSDVFARIEPGDNVITWTGLFGFDLMLYETRGIRPWM